MITIDSAKSMALEIKNKYPQASTVEEAYNLAIADELFTNKDDALAVWGRLMRLYPQQVA